MEEENKGIVLTGENHDASKRVQEKTVDNRNNDNKGISELIEPDQKNVPGRKVLWLAVISLPQISFRDLPIDSMQIARKLSIPTTV